jgi:hypothetical protein
LAQAITVLARTAQDAIWRRSKAIQELRALLREFYPGVLAAFAHGTATNLASPEARAILAIAPTPAAGARLSQARIATALRRAGRERGITTLAAHIQQTLRIPQLRQPPLVENTMGCQVSALLATLATECANAEQLTAAATEAFAQHPDHHIITSFPGLADLTGARLLAEIGDDRTRFTDARALKAYAGSAPVTRASSRSISITRRRVKTTDSTPWDSSGPLPPYPDQDYQKTTTTADEPAATGTPPLYDTCSTACSASSTTASTPAKPTTRSRHSANQQRPPTKRQLDFLARSEVYRDTPTRSGGSKHHPKRRSRSAPRHVSHLGCGSDHDLRWHVSDHHGQTPTWSQHTPILTVALTECGRGRPVDPRLDGDGEFGKGRRELSLRVGVDAEFVVAAPEILDERVAGANHAGGTQPFESAHRLHSDLEPSMIGFDGIVGVLLHDMACGGHQLIEHSRAGRCPICGHLAGPWAVLEGAGEEPAGGR